MEFNAGMGQQPQTFEQWRICKSQTFLRFNDKVGIDPHNCVLHFVNYSWPRLQTLAAALMQRSQTQGFFRNIISNLFAQANQIGAGMIYTRRCFTCAPVCPRLNCSSFIIFQAVCDQPSRCIALEVFYPFMRNPERHLRIRE